MTYNTAYTGQSAASTGAAAGVNQNDWQSIYNYAQQLYNAGYTQQAEQYHAYAQQLYNAELQAGQQGATAATVAAQATTQTVSHSPVSYQSTAPSQAHASTRPPVPTSTRAQASAQSYQSQAPTQSQTQAQSDSDSDSPPWKVLYDYAQRLHAAGQQDEAQKYWEQAQRLYSESSDSEEAVKSGDSAAYGTGTASRESYQTSDNRTAWSYSSAASGTAQQQSSSGGYYKSSATTQPRASYADSIYPTSQSQTQTQAQNRSTANNSIYTPPQTSSERSRTVPPSSSWSQSSTSGSTWGSNQSSWSYDPLAADSDNAGAAILRPKKSKSKRRSRLWTAGITAISIIVLMGAYMGLYSMYREQQSQKNEGTYYYNSVWGKIQGVTVQPMINGLKPIFEKNMRLSAAAQPLLYELNMSDKMPEREYPATATAGVATGNSGAATETGVVTGGSSALDTPTAASDAAQGTGDAADAPAAADVTAAAEADAAEKAAAEAAAREAADAEEAAHKAREAEEAEAAAAREKEEEEARIANARSRSRSSKAKSRRSRQQARRTERSNTQTTERVSTRSSSENDTSRQATPKKKKAAQKTVLSNDPLAGMGFGSATPAKTEKKTKLKNDPLAGMGLSLDDL